MPGARRYVRLRAEDFCAELAALFAALLSLVEGRADGGDVGRALTIPCAQEPTLLGPLGFAEPLRYLGTLHRDSAQGQACSSLPSLHWFLWQCWAPRAPGHMVAQAGGSLFVGW